MKPLFALVLPTLLTLLPLQGQTSDRAEGQVIPSSVFHLSSSAAQTRAKIGHPAPLVVGWHDEMNTPSLWKPLSLENQPDVYAEQPGRVTLRLPHVPEGYAYSYQWSGVLRTISADLARYPVLIARVSSLDAGSYAHLDIEECDVAGNVAHSWRSPTLTRPGLTWIDLSKEAGASTRRLTLRLIIGGKLTGTKAAYDWVRFVRRKDVAYLQEVPTLQNVTTTEPTGNAPAYLPTPAGKKE